MFDSAIELDLYDTLSKLYGDCEHLLKLANCPEWQYFLLHPKSLEWLILLQPNIWLREREYQYNGLKRVITIFSEASGVR